MTFGLPFILRSLTARAASRRGIIPGMRKIWLGLLAWSAFASYDPAIFSSLTWRSIGPARGGRSIASAGSSSRPLEYYFGATGGGLWKTTDGGLTWRPVTDEQLKSSSVGAVAVSESNPDVVYVGMGETELRGNIMQGDGVYKSADAGKTWKHMGLGDTQAISRIRVHPANPDVVYVSALGHPYGPNPERGVFRSKDGGQTWTKVLFRNDRSGAVDLCLDPKNPDVCSPPSGTPTAHHGAFRAADPPAASSNPPTAATTGPRSRATPACRKASSARSAWRCPAPTGTVYTPSWKTKMAASLFPTTRARHGNCSAKTAVCGSAPSTIRASTPTRR